MRQDGSAVANAADMVEPQREGSGAVGARALSPMNRRPVQPAGEGDQSRRDLLHHVRTSIGICAQRKETGVPFLP